MLRWVMRPILLWTLVPLAPALHGQEGMVLTIPKIGVDPYGSLRATLGVGEGGNVAIVNKLSRLGVRLDAPLGGDFHAFGRYEAGINLVDQNPKLAFVGGDDSLAAGQGSQALTTRLGFVGFSGAFGSVAIGKQWSVFYDIGDWTDRFNQVGGEAQGTYNVGTDGGISGTGRAENALIMRPPDLGPLSFGLQFQFRNRTANDRPGADAWGASLRWNVSKLVSLGAAVNVVNDGVEIPQVLEPKAGDQAAILGIKAQDGDLWTISLTVTKSKAHEVDNAGAYFDAVGTEMYSSYRFRPRWNAYLGFNDLRPTGDGYQGQYRKSYGICGVQWTLPLRGNSSAVFFEAKLDAGRTAQGDATHGTAAGTGIRLTF